MVENSSFEDVTNKNPKPWIRKSSEGTIKKSGGKSGQNFLRIHAGNVANSEISQKIISLDKKGISGQQFICEVWYKSPNKNHTSGTIQITDSDNPDKLKILHKIDCTSSCWKRKKFVFGIPPDTKNITLSIYGNNLNNIDLDDISIKLI